MKLMLGTEVNVVIRFCWCIVTPLAMLVCIPSFSLSLTPLSLSLNSIYPHSLSVSLLVSLSLSLIVWFSVTGSFHPDPDKLPASHLWGLHLPCPCPCDWIPPVSRSTDTPSHNGRVLLQEGRWDIPAGRLINAHVLYCWTSVF